MYKVSHHPEEDTRRSWCFNVNQCETPPRRRGQKRRRKELVFNLTITKKKKAEKEKKGVGP